jgi:hypothetical protein
MKPPALPVCASLALFLSACTGPGGAPVPLFGARSVPEYSDRREAYHSELREYGREAQLAAYERGYQDGSQDYAAGEARSYLRHARNYDDGTRAAYQEGYDKGYGSAPPAKVGNPVPQSDPAYSQGYDYGMRDRVAGRPADADAYAGSYDPRFRRSFERGYYNAFEAGPQR